MAVGAVGAVGSMGGLMSLVFLMFLMMAEMSSASLELLPYCASTAPLMGESSLSTEPVSFRKAFWRSVTFWL